MSAELIGAIDLGTTGVRFALYDQRAQCVGSAYREIPIATPQPGWVEQDPNLMLEATLAVLDETLSKDPGHLRRLAAIGIANQRETVIAWDRETGRPLHPAIVWQDRRTASRCRDLIQSDNERIILERTGLPIDPYFSATKIEWLLDQLPGLRERAETGKALLGTVDTWLLWQLTGKHATDGTNASRTMLFDISRGCWDRELLEIFGVPCACLPEILPSLSAFGTIKPELVSGADVRICGMLGDQQAALLGQGLTSAGEAQVTWGTGAFLLMNTGERRVTSKSGLVTTISCTSPGNATCFGLEGSVFVAGAAMQWLSDVLSLRTDSTGHEDLAWNADSTGGVVFVPALTGLGAPHWDPNARGLIIGLTRGTRSEHLVRATLEAIAYQTLDVVRAMERDTNERISGLWVGGGAARNDFLCQFQGDILGLPVLRPNDSETTARGAAYAAGIAIGFWDGFEGIRALPIERRTFEPSMAAEDRDQLITDWSRAIERAKDWAVT